MPIFERIFGSRVQRRSAGAQDLSLDESLLKLSPGALPFGVAVNNHNALNITALYAGIRIRSENIASFPKAVKKKTENGWEDDNSHSAYKLINQRPNSYTNKFDFWNCINTWLDGWGNAYALIEWKGGIPVALHQIHPSFVRVVVLNGRKWYDVRVTVPGMEWLSGLYKDEEMLHFMLLTLDGIKGENPIIRNAMALGKNMATEKFASEFYEKGGNIKGVMEMEGHMDDDTYVAWAKHYKASSKNFDTPLLEYGLKYKQLSVDPIAAQLIQSEIFSVQDIARILNLPPHLLSELSHATYSNIEEQNIQFVQLSLRPTVKRLEDELENKLLLGDEIDKYSIKFNLDGLLRGNTKDRAAFYHNAILDGYMSRNEVRQLEGMSSKEGLDIMLYPQNEGFVGVKNNNEDK